MRLIAQPPQAPRGFRPRTPQIRPGLIELRRADLHLYAQLTHRRAQVQGGIGELMARQKFGEPGLIAGQNLHHHAGLLGKQLRQRRAAPRRQRDVQSAVAGERHLQQRHEQPAVGAIVIRAQHARGARFREGRREAREPLRLVQVRRFLAQLPVYLRQRRGAQAVAAAGQVDEPQ